MIFPFKVRKTLAIDLEISIHEETFNVLPALGKLSDHQEIDTSFVEARELSALRGAVMNALEKKTHSRNDIDVIITYAESLTTLSQKTGLSRTSFPWSNSLSVSRATTQDRGIQYEILNVLFNLAALFTSQAVKLEGEKAAIWYRRAAGVFDYLLATTIPRLEKLPPPELEQSTLQFLQDLMLSKAAILSALDGKAFWSASLRYRELADRASNFAFLGSEWHDELQEISCDLAARACLNVANSLARSRKHDDHLLRKGALIKCMEICKAGSVAEDAEKQLNEPMSRRSKSSLIDLEEVTLFVPSTYFDLVKSDLAITPIELELRRSPLFQNTIPIIWMNAPYVLRQKLQYEIRTQLSEELIRLNCRTMSTLAEYNFPLSLECSMRPSAVPESLSSLLTDIKASIINFTSKDSHTESTINEELGHPLIEVCRAKLTECRRFLASLSDFTNELDVQILRRKLEEGEAAFSKLVTTATSHTELHKLLIDSAQAFDGVSYPEPLLTFLGISMEVSNKQKQKSKPMLMARAQELFENLRTEMKARTQYQLQLESKAASLEFLPIIQAHNVTADQVSPDAVQSIFNSAFESFADDFTRLNAEQDKVERQIRRIHDLHSQHLSFSRNLTKTEVRLRATQSLMRSSATLMAVDAGLKTCLSCIEPLLELFNQQVSRKKLSVPQDKTFDTSPCLKSTGSEPANLTWKPGHQIDICIR